MPVKAKIVEQKVCDDPLGYVHGFFYNVRRLLVEEYDLVITVDRGVVHTFSSNELGDGYEIVGETEIPPGILLDAMNHMDTGKRLSEMIPVLNVLTGKPAELSRSDVTFEITTDGEDPSVVRLNEDGSFTITHLTEGVENEGPRSE